MDLGGLFARILWAELHNNNPAHISLNSHKRKECAINVGPHEIKHRLGRDETRAQKTTSTPSSSSRNRRPFLH